MLLHLNPWQLFGLLALFFAGGWWIGHHEGLRCSCPGPRKTKVK
jgi:hypothetical protein